MAKILKPRRGKRADAINNNVVLAQGEIFFEVPTTGEGTGTGKIYMGDGTTPYGNLPAFIDLSTKADQAVTITYAQYLQMSEQERLAGVWIIPDYPGSDGAGNIADLGDVNIAAAVNGQVLMFIGTTMTWYNGTIPSPDGKADKVDSATEGDLAGLDSNGNLTDSGIAASNVITKSATAGLVKNDGTIDTTQYISDVSGKADKVSGATNGNLAGLDSNGNLTDSGKNPSDFALVSNLGTAAAKNVPASGNAGSSEVVLGNDSRLSDSRPASDVSEWAKASSKPTYTASEVGAAASSHDQAASTITAGTLAGAVVANATAVANLGTKQVRNIYAGTADLTPGTSALPTGDIYICYE